MRAVFFPRLCRMRVNLSCKYGKSMLTKSSCVAKKLYQRLTPVAVVCVCTSSSLSLFAYRIYLHTSLVAGSSLSLSLLVEPARQPFSTNYIQIPRYSHIFFFPTHQLLLIASRFTSPSFRTADLRDLSLVASSFPYHKYHPRTSTMLARAHKLVVLGALVYHMRMVDTRHVKSL